MHTRLQARVTRYYTAAKNKVEDNKGNCNDKDLTIGSDVDSNQSFDSNSKGDEDFNKAIDSGMCGNLARRDRICGGSVLAITDF
jgi:hypothetical protein